MQRSPSMPMQYDAEYGRVSQFMQREMSAVQFAGGDPNYEAKLRRHYSLEAIPAVRSRYANPESQHRRASHFQPGLHMKLLDARNQRQMLAASQSDESLSPQAIGASHHHHQHKTDQEGASHFVAGQGGATLVESAENATRLPSDAKSHYSSEWMNDRAASYDLVCAYTTGSPKCDAYCAVC